MSTSNSPQTLFRFVSLRNPKLAETSQSNLGFIPRPIRMEGVFDAVETPAGSSKFQALLAEATNFEPESIKTIKELEELGFSKLLQLGKSIANQETLSPEDLKLCKDYYLKFASSTNAVKKLWENLIYQVISQKDFYVKESIAHIIKALHVGYVQTLTADDELKRVNGDDLITKAINAIIVLPKEIFEDDDTSSSVANKTAAENLTNRENVFLKITSEKNQTEQNHAFERDNFVNLKLELEAIQKKYNTSRNNEYKSSLERYNAKYSEKIKAYEQQLEVIEELEQNNANEEELKLAYEELKKYEVPSFEFKFKNELNWEDLYKRLSQDLFGWFLIYFSDADENDFSNIDFNTAEINVVSDEELKINENSIFFTEAGYYEIFEKIGNQIHELNTNFLNKATLNQDKLVNIGGVLVPLSKSSEQITDLSYVLKAYKPSSVFLSNTNLGYVSLQIQVENPSWSVSHALISAETNLGTQTENFDTIEVVDNKINFAQFLKNKFKNISSLSVQLFFNNGKEASLELNEVTVNTEITGVLLSSSPTGITGKARSKGDDTSVGIKHFGLKRLGVAEYLKVVQTTHAYVPGEVSNIENVMASELRHKSVNELTRTEDTLTTTKSQEVEKISDTTKTDRSEMQSEVAKEIDRQQSFEAHANFTYDTKAYKLDLGASYASTNAQHTSNMQAVTKSKEITERAMERVQSKITEERIKKIIQEVSLTNVHEFDNRGGLGTGRPEHITGVYRWVDKKMKNQIYNYGLRTMFEFMIPEPAKLHRLAYLNTDTLVPPVDPRKAPAPHTMANVNSVTNALLEYWAGIYSLNLTTLLPATKQIIHNTSSRPDTNDDFIDTTTLHIPENYVARNGAFSGTSSRNRGGGSQGSRYSTLQCSNLKGDLRGDSYRASVSFSFSETGLNVTDDFEFKVAGHNVDNYSVKAIINCELTSEYINAWKLENFNLIIDAYTKAFEAYKEEKAAIEAEQKAKEGEQKETQANFYRIIESDLLKHNCIAYLLQDYLFKLGQGFATGTQMSDFNVTLNDNLDKYTAVVKFLEQAFEWSIKDYTFYPYYWADRAEWKKMYLTESIDPLFRTFLQAGMARVIVTVKPGFEEAVQYFLVTGQVWFGGETPVIGDPLYMSIAQEMKDPTGVPQGNYWITRIPTTLTILQAKSTGLDVEEPLPIFPESHPENCENPEELETVTHFKLDDIQLNASDRPSTLPSNS